MVGLGEPWAIRVDEGKPLPAEDVEAALAELGPKVPLKPLPSRPRSPQSLLGEGGRVDRAD